MKLTTHLSSSAEDKNEWSYASTPPMRLNGVDRENFTFYQTITVVTRRYKVKFNLEQATKAQRGSKVIALLFLEHRR
jgi:hypothetical protein